MTHIDSTTAFVESLRSIRVLDADQLEQVRQESVTAADPRTLASRLLQRGWLTAYQVNQLLTGQGPSLVLGSYLLMERLGTGGMGQVFKARHQRLGRMVALKVILKERLKDPDVLRRFRREIQAVAQLSHPNIVLAFDADEVDGTHFFTMEYVEGMNLAMRVKRGGPLPIEMACDFVRQTALGLQHAHERGLVHRDIKPTNLLVAWTSKAARPESDTLPGGSSTGEAVVKILDLGLARLHLPGDAKGSSQDLTSQGLFIGTPDFVSPEQAVDPHGADIRSDLYSLGCTFYFLLTGAVPFPYGTTVNKLFSHRLDEPRPVEKVRPEVTLPLAKIVRRLMAKDPAGRYQTPAEVASDLRDLLGGDGRKQRRPTAAQTQRIVDAGAVAAEGRHRLTPKEVALPGRYLRRTRRGWWLTAASFGALLLGSTVLMAFLLGSTPASVRPSVGTSVSAAPPLLTYVRRPTRKETLLATLKANGWPNLDGKWHMIGAFDSDHGDKGFDTVYPPEQEIRLDRSYPGKKGKGVRWQECGRFQLGIVVDLRLFEENDLAVVYLYHAFDAATATDLPLGLGSDDTLTVWLNGEKLLAKKQHRAVTPDEDHVTMHCKPGKNELLLKICNFNGNWGVYVMPAFPPELERAFGDSLRRDFPNRPRKS